MVDDQIPNEGCLDLTDLIGHTSVLHNILVLEACLHWVVMLGVMLRCRQEVYQHGILGEDEAVHVSGVAGVAEYKDEDQGQDLGCVVFVEIQNSFGKEETIQGVEE